MKRKIMDRAHHPFNDSALVPRFARSKASAAPVIVTLDGMPEMIIKYSEALTLLASFDGLLCQRTHSSRPGLTVEQESYRPHDAARLQSLSSLLYRSEPSDQIESRRYDTPRPSTLRNP